MFTLQMQVTEIEQNRTKAMMGAIMKLRKSGIIEELTELEELILSKRLKQVIYRHDSLEDHVLDAGHVEFDGVPLVKFETYWPTS